MRRPKPVLIGLTLALGLVLGGCETFEGLLDSKKPLPGERKTVFPDGVPGVPQGVPRELVKGYQPPPEPEPTPPPVVAERPKPKPRPRPKQVAAPKQQPATTVTVQPAAQPAPAASPFPNPASASPPPSGSPFPDPPRPPGAR